MANSTRNKLIKQLRYCIINTNRKLKNIFITNFEQILTVIILLILTSYIYLILRALFLPLIETYLVIPFFSKFGKSCLLDIVWVLANTLIILKIYKKFKRNYQISKVRVAIYILLLAGYLYEINSENFIYTRLKLFGLLRYSDAIFIFLFSNILLVIKHFTSKKPNGNVAAVYLADEPLKDEKYDLLNYSKLAKELAEKLNNLYLDNSLSVAINGEWGSGKTTFLNLLKNHLSKENSIIMDFNPYIIGDKKEYKLKFYEILSKEVCFYSDSINRILKEYIRELKLNNSENFFAKTIYFWLNKLTIKYEDFEISINEQITAINKNIYIFIDDVDRLNKEEIIETLKIIRYGVNFKRIIFITAFDRYYVEKTLAAKTNQSYVEKFFQIINVLPKVDRLFLRDKFIDSFDSKLFTITEQRLLIYLTIDNYLLYFSILTNVRQIKLFYNFFMSHCFLIKEEVELFDFFNILLIKFKFPEQLEYVYNNINSLRISDKKEIKINTEILERELNNSKIDKEELKLFLDLIQVTFNKPQKIKYKGLNNPLYFERYFSWTISPRSLLQKERDNLNRLVKDEKLKELKILFNKINPKEILDFLYNSETKFMYSEFLDSIEIALEFNEFYLEMDTGNKDYTEFYNLIAKNNCKISDRKIIEDRYVYRPFADKLEEQEYKKFLLGLFRKDNRNIQFMFELIKHILSHDDRRDTFVLNNEDLALVLTDYMYREIKKVNVDQKLLDEIYLECYNYEMSNMYDFAMTPIVEYVERKGYDNCSANLQTRYKAISSKNNNPIE